MVQPHIHMTDKKSSKKQTANQPPNDNEGRSAADPIAMGRTLMDVYERAGPIFEEAFKRYSDDVGDHNFDPFNIAEAYQNFMQGYLKNPEKFWEEQQDYWSKYMQLWQDSARKMMGEEVTATIEPDKGDRRFKDDEWQENAVFDFLKQSYLLTSQWMENTVRSAEDMDPHQREKLAFATQLFANALSPSNFVMTNPEVLRETMASGGDNLLRGLDNLLDDLERGKGELKISTTDYEAFTLGENIATTPGRVVYQNDLMQLIQYAPSTDKVFKRPLLIVPPWINKFYILDLRAENSLIKWAVDQGHTVFAVSWVNPDIRLAKKQFEDYMSEGIIAALDDIKRITKEPDCNVIGYCLGGTLLTNAMAYLKTQGKESRVTSATFLTTLIDFEEAGDLKMFMDDDQLELMNKELAEKGVLQAKRLQQTFSLLRSNDLIWSFVVNNYLLGKEPFPFDLLYWNDDSTNMPAAMHSFYLRKMYRDNLLTKAGGLEMHGVPIDVSTIKTPAYFLSTREDHIAPWKATYAGTQLLGSKDITFTLAASGHIAGVVNPPAKNKYCYWVAKDTPADPDEWLESATEHEGSWWPHWQTWIKRYAGTKVTARKVKKGIEAAPGSYVKVSNA